MKTWATVRAKEKKTQLNEAFFERGGRWVEPPDLRANPRCGAIYLSNKESHCICS
jgi:hypothetical protein